MFTNKNNRISEYLRPLKLLVTKFSAEAGFSHIIQLTVFTVSGQNKKITCKEL
jgi:hypothetical protein